MNSLSSEIMVGIDFGTTHSGVSWAINEGQKKIRLITDWPNLGDSLANQDKVPSIISYNNGRVANWGYEVSCKEESFRWIKILLEPESKYARTVQEVRDSNELLQKLNKTAEEVIRDYLREIWRYTKEDIRKRVGDDDWEETFTIHVVLTVPAMWSHAAKDKTLRAARDANLPANIKLVTEPEAAALATLHDKAEENALAPGDTFIVCDAGGGTVDLISYKVNQTNPLEIEECAIGDGGLCGSIFLDTSFEKHIRTLVGETQYANIKPIHKLRMMKMFELGVKRSFTSESNKDYSVDLRGVEDNFDEGIEDDCITLKSYGVSLAVPFDHKIHLWQDRVLDPSNNTYMASNQMRWLLRREPEPPSRMDENVKQLCSVDFTVPEYKIWMETSYKSAAVPGKWRDMTFEVFVLLGSTTLDFVVAYQNEPVGHVEAKYMQDF
ncbi:hypothetical protein EDB80DRAFT_574486 [Ilyonectria destructans]|nr:hypothetical protein EDB80DRAFT_574486 [Ilyonectria destructans]